VCVQASGQVNQAIEAYSQFFIKLQFPTLRPHGSVPPSGQRVGLWVAKAGPEGTNHFHFPFIISHSSLLPGLRSAMERLYGNAFDETSVKKRSGNLDTVPGNRSGGGWVHFFLWVVNIPGINVHEAA